MAGANTQLVRLRAEIYRDLHDLAESEETTMQEVLAKAIAEYRRQRFWEQTNAAYAALRADPTAWQEELEERAQWDLTLADGLDDAYEDERLSAPAISTTDGRTAQVGAGAVSPLDDEDPSESGRR